MHETNELNNESLGQAWSGENDTDQQRWTSFVDSFISQSGTRTVFLG